MRNQALVMRAGALCALAGVVLLSAMAVIGFSAGEGLFQLGQPGPVEAYAGMLRPVAPTLVWVMALDNLFLIGYTGAFIGAAVLVWRRAKIFGAIGLGFALLTALLDLTENAVTIHLARIALAEMPISATQVFVLSVLGQVKYAGAGLALIAFAVAVWIASAKRGPLSLIVTVLFGLFPVVNALTLVYPAVASALIGWMFLSLLASAILLWRAAQGQDFGVQDIEY